MQNNKYIHTNFYIDTVSRCHSLLIVLSGRCITESVFYISTRKREVVIIKRLEDDNMPYIICNNDNYLHRNKKNNFSIVHNMEEASKWSDAQKADNVCTINAKELTQKYGLEVKYVSQENKVINPPAKPIELEYDILDKVKEISEFTKQIEERKLYLIEMIHTVDLEIVDIEHAAEFYNLNASQGYKLYKLLHDSRIKRRELKDELEKINLSLGTSIRSVNMENLERSIIGLEHRQYTPRINKELFGV